MNTTFWKASIIRAIRTVCQTAVATIGTSFTLGEVDWLMVASASVLSGILSVLTSVATGLPEAEELIGDDDDDVDEPTFEEEEFTESDESDISDIQE